MKRIPPLGLVWFIFLATVVPGPARAGSCGPNGCPFTTDAPPVQRTSAIISTSHGFTATGGTRVADINLSPEAREVINAGGKEEPLPKGFMSAADRAKLIASQPPLYGWPEDKVARPVSKTPSHFSNAKRVARNSRGVVVRSPTKPVTQGTPVKVAVAAKAESQDGAKKGIATRLP